MGNGVRLQWTVVLANGRLQYEVLPEADFPIPL